MSTKLAAPPAIPVVTEVRTLTVGVEPMRVGLYDGSILHENARAAVVLRDAGRFVQVLTTDNDPHNCRPLLIEAARLAYCHNATVAPAQWPTCPYCGKRDDVCTSLWLHLRWARDNDSTRLRAS